MTGDLLATVSKAESACVRRRLLCPFTHTVALLRPQRLCARVVNFLLFFFSRTQPLAASPFLIPAASVSFLLNILR